MAEPEFHRPVPVDRLPAQEHSVVATPGECAALARRMAIPAVLSLTCRFRLRAEAGGIVLAEGALSARVVRDCVVSLDPFEMDVAERFRVRFVPTVMEPEDEEGWLDPAEDDEIGYGGSTVDLGEAAAEQLALALDPYPRKPGAEMPEEGGEDRLSPFAALARLRRPPD